MVDGLYKELASFDGSLGHGIVNVLLVRYPFCFAYVISRVGADSAGGEWLLSQEEFVVRDSILLEFDFS